MTSDRRDKGSKRIPIRFTDADDEVESSAMDMDDEVEDLSSAVADLDSQDLYEGLEVDAESGGPDTAELVATRAEL